MCDAIVYLLCSEISSKTYIGYTTNLIQRLRRHNGEITGGARYTKQDRPWKCVLFVSGFKDKCDAMSFEWHAKHKKSIKSGKYYVVQKLKPRIENIEKLVELRDDLVINY